jgi:hypothetical protein
MGMLVTVNYVWIMSLTPAFVVIEYNRKCGSYEHGVGRG